MWQQASYGLQENIGSRWLEGAHKQLQLCKLFTGCTHSDALGVTIHISVLDMGRRNCAYICDGLVSVAHGVGAFNYL